MKLWICGVAVSSLVISENHGKLDNFVAFKVSSQNMGSTLNYSSLNLTKKSWGKLEYWMFQCFE